MKCRVRGNSGGAAKCGERWQQPPVSRRQYLAFTLLEVMIAGGILFVCLFAILSLVSNGLRNAALLSHQRVDASMAAAMLTVQFTTTNQVAEGKGSGDFGKDYPDYHYKWELTQVGTNGLCELYIQVLGRSPGKTPDSQLTTLLYLPNLQQNGIGPR
jgi:hypothetical protein